MDNCVSFLPRYHHDETQKLGALWDKWTSGTTPSGLMKNPISTQPRVPTNKANVNADKQKKKKKTKP